MPIHLKRLDGTVTRYRNAEYIPAYLFLPESVLNRCPQELHLPRIVFSFFHDRDVIRVVESNLFIELMMDAYAFLVWPYLGVRGYMESYSGYDPVYIIAHSPGFWVQELTDERILHTGEDLFRSGQAETMAYPSEAVVSDYLAQIIPAAMGKYNLDVVIETATAMRCPEDFDFRQSGVKIDFFRQWYHTRTQRAEFSLEAYNKKRFNQYEANEIDIPDTTTDMEASVIAQADVERFLTGLNEKDREIFQLRSQGWTMEEIAAKLDYKNHSGVLKRLKKIGAAYKKYISDDLK
jgi:hypothetical protein